MTKKRYTGECPTCHRRVTCSEEGTISKHTSPNHYDRMARSCWGSLRRAVKDSVLEDDTVATYRFVWGL